MSQKQIRSCLGCLGVVAGVVWAPSVLSEGPARDSTRAMGQGEASIQVRSDVELSVKGAGGTPKQRLDALAAVVSGTLPRLRACYRDRVQADPTVTGAFRMGVRLSQDSRAAALQVEERKGSDAKLRRCVEATLGEADYQKVGRPAEATVTLRFNNSRAAGQQSLEQTVAGSSFEVLQVGEGKVQGGWADPGGRITFLVTGDELAVVDGALRGLRDNYAAFLDCRRRAERGGLSPAGTLQLEVQGRAAGALRARVRDSSVPSHRAPACVTGAVQRSRCEACERRQISVDVTLGP